MNCSEVRELLDAHHDGELEPEARAEVDAHVRICASCEQRLAELDWLERKLTDYKVPPPAAGLAGRILERTQPSVSTGTGGSPIPSPSGGPMSKERYCPNCLAPLGSQHVKCDYCRMYREGTRVSTRSVRLGWVVALVAIISTTAVVIESLVQSQRSVAVQNVRSPSPSADADADAWKIDYADGGPPSPLRKIPDLKKRVFRAVFSSVEQRRIVTKLADFTLEGGPIPGTESPAIDDSINAIAIDPAGPTLYACSDHAVGVLRTVGSQAKKMTFSALSLTPNSPSTAAESDPSSPEIDFGRGMAFDLKRRRLFVADQRALYVYSPDRPSASGRWAAVGDSNINRLFHPVCMTYFRRDDALCLIDLTHEGSWVGGELVKLSMDGKVLARHGMQLLPSVPGHIGLRLDKMQLIDGGDHLVLFGEVRGRLDAAAGSVPQGLERDESDSAPQALERLYLDPDSGRTLAHWPFWSDKPKPATHQDTELHVIGVNGGALSTQETRSRVLVNVSRTEAPIVLVLASGKAIFWTLNVQPGVRLKEVIQLGKFPLKVQGIPTGVPVRSFKDSQEGQAPGRSTHFPSLPISRNCANSDKNYGDLVKFLRFHTGLEITSFQWRNVAREFAVDRSSEPEPTPAETCRIHVVAVESGARETFRSRGESSIHAERRSRTGAGGAEAGHTPIEKGAQSGVVRVVLRPSPHPVILVLSSRENTCWRLEAGPGARLDRVVLIGPEGSRVLGVDPGVRIVDERESETKEPLIFPFRFDELTSREMAIQWLTDRYKRPVATYQGTFFGKSFTIP